MSKRVKLELPDLPEDFVEHMKRSGKRVMSLTEIVEEYKKFRREKHE